MPVPWWRLLLGPEKFASNNCSFRNTESVATHFLNPPLIPLPEKALFGDQCGQYVSIVPQQACLSTRIHRVLSRLDLGAYSFSCELDNQVSSVPNLHSNYEYVLHIDKQKIHVHAVEEWGALAALSTLAQLWVGFQGHLPDCEISDRPKHPWRGLLVDVARHFISIPTLYRCCDLMHHFKMNVLHLHLSDDQGFRFGSVCFPELVSSEHYSLDELIRLVAYAADLGIRVVPELDVPGHTTSWLTHHPEWGFGKASELKQTEFGSHRSCLDPSNPKAMEAVLTLFEELATTFPDEYMHIGGDEVDPHHWEDSESVQSWASNRQLKSVRDIQAHFTLKVCNHLAELNKKTIVWDEALHETLPHSVTVQAWRGLRAREVSVEAGYPTIVSAPYYLDLHYPASMHFIYSPAMSPRAWQDADTQVRSNPVLAHVGEGVRWHQDFGEFPLLTRSESGPILGGEACMWSELVSDELLLTRIWTRAPVIAECFWSDHDSDDVEDMYKRLSMNLQGLPTLGLPDVSNIQTIHPCAVLAPLFEMLEPIKWYGRSLTMERVRARAAGLDENVHERPYNQQTLLDRVVDRIPPESLAAFHLAQRIKRGEDLSPWVVGWQNQYIAFDECANKYPELAELRPASEALAKLADVALGMVAYDPTLLGPFGEYLLPIATAFADDS